MPHQVTYDFIATHKQVLALVLSDFAVSLERQRAVDAFLLGAEV